MTPKVGLVTCVHPIYNLPSVTKHRDDAIAGLRAAGCEVAAPEIARDSRDVPGIAQMLRREEIDVLLLFFCTWVAEEIPLGLVTELDNVPLLLWALPYLDKTIPMPSPITGLSATGCNIRRLGRGFCHMVGAATAENAAKAARYARTAAVVKAVRKARLGIIGHPCPGMIDTGCDEAALQKCLGTTVVHRDLDNLLRAAEGAGAAEASELAVRLAARVGTTEVTQDTIAQCYRLYLGMRSIVNADRLDGVTVRCWPELRDHHKTPVCLTLSEMAESGVAVACESDITALLTSYILTQLAGAPSYSFDISGYLEDEQAIQLAHCGSAPLSMAGDPKDASVRGHMRTGAGALIEFGFRPGAATIAKLMRPANGRMRMFATRAEVIPTAPEVRGSVATIRPEPSAERLLDCMLREAVEHHLILVYGDWTGELAQFSEFAGIELVRP
jgi:L-fucose isomerase-like protein